MTRVRVTAPRSVTPGSSAAARRPVAPPIRAKPPRNPTPAQVFIRSLIRSQLRLACVVAAGFLLILAAFPLMLGLVPGLAESTIAGLPFDWVLLGAGIYPVVGLSAWLYVRTADRNEARYRDLVGDK